MENDDPILRYYEAEMRYLRESGREFAKAHPDRARLLNLDRVGDRDPYVERLFEGFAFLTGRLRQKLDDELPELTEGLVSLLWPHYLRMIPSLSVVQLIPLADKLQKTEIVPAGVPVRSAPIAIPPPAGADGSVPKTVQCLYRTTQAVTLQPLSITDAGPSVRHDGRSVIRIGFALDGSARRNETGMLRHEAPERYFHTRVRPGVSGLHETWVILGGHAWETMDTLPEESLSLRVTGTNGLLPRKGLREASLNELAASPPNVAGVRNLVSPTLPLYPPTEDRFQWRVLSHLAPNFLSMMNAEVLRGALALYDWTDDELNRRRLAGIRWVSQELIEEVTGGSVERGVLIEVTLDSHAFSGEGDVMLFGELLHRFFAQYAEINLFTKLSIVSLPSQTRTIWPRSKAQRAPL
ncbi:type VI secretion system baseplate subunit TssF [Burkholderia glumae]|uniref:type VI secretion system baseplate subunit TssF n=1 Tax=Burkholderia glumae TaxID=337 RepID=UPI0003A27D6C|nr:type VI secretion system baseplate subunit TssF [Burkholderia glumae]